MAVANVRWSARSTPARPRSVERGPGTTLALARRAMRNLPVWGAVALLAAPGLASALSQAKHFEVSLSACSGAMTAVGFCQSAAMAAHNTDGYEWTDMAAHAQIPEGASACAGAKATTDRLASLGSAIREKVFAIGAAQDASSRRALAKETALLLGRALHTLQDNCAHHGMPNPQHAWHSHSDTCKGTSQSPDLAPSALTCAGEQSRAAFSAFKELLTEAQVEVSALADTDGTLAAAFPKVGEVCEFLHSAATWDGVDRRWSNEVVVPALMTQLTRGFSQGQATGEDLCASDPDQLVPASVDPVVDTQAGPGACAAVDAFCSGDPSARLIPPWEKIVEKPPSGGGSDGGSSDKPPSPKVGGCSAAGSGLAYWIAAGVLAALARRRE